MRDYFYDLSDRTMSALRGGEVLLANLQGEDSDFCRLNNNQVRQAGSVRQALLSLRLIVGQRNAEVHIGLTMERAADDARIREALTELRRAVEIVPEDPHLLYATEVCSSERRLPKTLPESGEAVHAIIRAAKGLDLVGIYASGAIFRGFANSLGQRNWYESHSFNFDWSFYLRADKAVKAGYAGFEWRDDELVAKVAAARQQLSVLERPARDLRPGAYRAYLAPDALLEVVDMLSWGGFSCKALRTKDSPLLKLAAGDVKLSPLVTMRENTAGGIAPDFGSTGFVKPKIVTLVDQGRYAGSLVSPRSAKEFSLTTNGASDAEAPQSFEIGAGSLDAAQAAAALGEGIYLNNLWYLNFSDRPACRLTGMTRFAAFWVEKGNIVAPLNVMRFDDSALRFFGDNLEALTSQRDMLMSSSTYGQRSTSSSLLPGALLRSFQLTL